MSERWLWTQKEDIGPSPRYGHTMAYEAARQRVVLFGGSGPYNTYSGNTYFGDTWVWDGSAWTQVADTGPDPRTLHSMVYDDSRQRVVLFGGFTSPSTHLGDTWEWDGTEWTQVADIGPRGRYGCSLTYDTVRQRVVLFGGFALATPGAPASSNTYFGDTWEWDGTEWTQIADTGPSERYAPAMAFDRSRECQVLFGGLSQATWLNDTWEWGDGTGWVKRQDMGPRSIAFPKITYTEKGTVLFACKSGVFVGSGQTWEWDGKLWTQHQDMGPKARYRCALVYDSQRDRVVLFGGDNEQMAQRLGDTWELAIIEQPPE